MMQIFGFDMTLARMAAKQKFGPGFLIHDSHLFDGVDPRQVRHAIAAGIEEAKHGLRDIVTDELRQGCCSASGWTDTKTYALDVQLNDQPTGGLFGKRFG